ncbi:MAG: glycosyl hydrolase family 28-related protein [Gemmataceae bacterium]
MNVTSCPFLFCALAFLAQPLSVSYAQNFVPPEGSGYVNVKTDCGAKGDGKTDDTQALKAILERGKNDRHPKFGAAREIYFPDGVYLISEPLIIGDKKKILMGQSRDGVVIKLKDNSPAFQDPKKPKAILDYTKYKGWFFAQNFGQRIYNITFDVGAGNPGAIGLRYHTNNSGDVYNVRIRSSDPKKVGAIGLALEGGPGPGLIHNVTIDGFDIGINFPGSLHSLSFSRIAMKDQREVGMWVRGNTASIETLTSQNKVPALRVSGGHVAMTAAILLGGDSENSAIELRDGRFFARNISTKGYGSVIVDPENATVQGPKVDQYVWPKAHSLFDDPPKKSLNLRIEHPPEMKLSGVEWKLVVPSGKDLTKPLQRAIDDGHEYIFVSCAKFGEIRDTIHVRNKVKVIMGAPMRFRSVGFQRTRAESLRPLKLVKPKNQKPLWRIEDGASPVVMIKGMADTYGSAGWGVDHASKRTLVLWAAGGRYVNTVTGGKVFFVDAGPRAGSVIQGPQKAWSWSANPESYVHQSSILNLGAILWLLGIKTEKDRTVVTTKDGGYTELIGGLLFKNRERVGPAPAFVNENSHISLSYRITRLPYQQHVIETRGKVKKEMPFRGPGWHMPLYTGYTKAAPEEHYVPDATSLVVPGSASLPLAGEPVTLKGIRYVGKGKVTDAKLFVRKVGQSKFKALPLAGQGDNGYRVTIPATITEQPFEYYVQIVLDGRKTIAQPPTGAVNAVRVSPDAKAPVLTGVPEVVVAKNYAVALKWKPAIDDTGVSFYRLVRVSDPKKKPTDGNMLAQLSAKELTFRDKAPPAGRTIYYGVQPVDKAGRNGEWKFVKVAVPRNIPPEVTVQLTATAVGSHVHLKWSGELEPDVTTIELLRGEGKDGELKLLQTIEDLKTHRVIDKTTEGEKKYCYALRLKDSGGLTSRPSPAQLVKASLFIKRINCGGKKVVGEDGVEWEADTKSIGGTGRWSTDKKIAGVSNALQAIYQSERWANYGLVFTFDVKPGKYEVVLHLAETNKVFSKKGARTYDLEINGQKHHKGVDVFAKVGAFQGYPLVTPVEIKGGRMRVVLRKRNAGPSIKGIEVRGVSAK